MNTERKVISTRKLALLHFYIGALGLQILFGSVVGIVSVFIPQELQSVPLTQIVAETTYLGIIALSVFLSVRFLNKRYQINQVEEIAKESTIINAGVLVAVELLILVLQLGGAYSYWIPSFDIFALLQTILSNIGELAVFYLLSIHWLRGVAAEATSS